MSNLSTLLPAGASGKTFEAVASAIIASKEPVVIDTAGTVSSIAETVVAAAAVGSLQTLSAYQTEHLWVDADPFNDNRWIAAWMDDVGTKDCYVRVITRSGTTLTMSSQNEFFGGGNSSGISVRWDPVTENNFLCIYNNSSNYGSAVAGTVSGTVGSESFSYGSDESNLFGDYLLGQNLTALGTSGSWLVTWGKSGDLKAYGRILQLTSSKAISAGGSNTVLSSSAMYSYRSCTSAVEASSSTAALACIIRSNAIKGIPLTISGTTISLGTEATIDSGTNYHADTWGYGTAIAAANATTYILQCQKTNEDQMVLAIRLSGGSFSNGTPVTVSTTSGTRVAISNNLTSPNSFVIQYNDAKPTVRIGTLDDTTITLGTAFVTASSVTTISTFTGIAQQSDAEAHSLGVFRSNAISGSALYGHAQCSSSGSTTTNNTALVGLADAAIAADATGTIVVRGGTVTGANVSEPKTLSFGSAAVYESAAVTDNSATFDSNSNKVVIAYKDAGNSSYGTAVVGTVSGTSISWGTPVVYQTATVQQPVITFDSTNNKVVIAYYYYTGGANLGHAIVGTVSGTAISFGTAVAMPSGNSTTHQSITYDSNAGKVVASYRNSENSDYGTSIVGTVSGTSISWGTPVVFETANAQYTSSTFDSNSNKVVISYQDYPNSQYGTAIVGTVSGTSISFGTAVVYESASTKHISSTFDSDSNKVVIAYRDAGNSDYGTAIVGTVSGTAISFGTAVVFETAQTSNTTTTFDSNSNKVVISYKDAGNSEYGTTIVGTVSGTSISYITAVVFETAVTEHISSTFDSDSNKVVVAYRDEGNSNYGTGIVGTLADGVFTIGSNYYVQGDGTLNTSSNSPAVMVGKAISATSLLLTGDS